MIAVYNNYFGSSEFNYIFDASLIKIIMDIKVSILSLAKNNNGYFKSEKQASFLINQINNNNGVIGYSEAKFIGRESGLEGAVRCNIMCECDELGITKIWKDRLSGDDILFERMIKGEYNKIQMKAIKRVKRAIKVEEREIASAQARIDGGDLYWERFLQSHKNELKAELKRLQELLNPFLGVRFEKKEAVVNENVGHHYKDKDRVELTVKIIKELEMETYYGKMHIITFQDELEKEYVYSGSTPPEIKSNVETKIKATIKHDEYRGEKQTKLQRIKTL